MNTTSPGTTSDSLEHRLAEIFFQAHAYYPNIKHPATFSEKVQYRKLFDRDPRMPRLADKLLAKKYVAEILGEEWVVPLIWSGRYLPARHMRDWQIPYVLKASHGCKWNLFIRSSADQNWDMIEVTSEKWLREVHGVNSGEWLYSEIEPRLLVEPYLGTELEVLPVDYKFWTFHGRVHYVQVCTDRDVSSYHSSFYGREWSYQGVKLTKNPDPVPKPMSPPDSLDKMIWASELLGRDFSFVRIDFYEINQKPLFGEMTFYPTSGFTPFTPPLFDEILGRIWLYP